LADLENHTLVPKITTLSYTYKGKGRHKKSRKRYISPIRAEAPVNGFSPNFAHQEICWT